jgi:hypothetical protein
VIVGAGHDLPPQFRRAHLPIDPQSVAAAIRAAADQLRARCRAMHELPCLIGDDGLHERIGGGHREIEVAQVAAILGVNERLHVGMIAAQHAHLRAAAGARRLDGFAGLVEHPHVG